MQTIKNRINKIILPKIYLLKNGDKMMKIENVQIDNICGIKHIDIKFNKGLNLICGANGVGKSTILRAIAHYFFDYTDNFITKYYGSDKGTVSIKIYGNETVYSYSITDSMLGNSYKIRDTVFKTDGENMLYFLPFRTIEYDSIKRLPSATSIIEDSLYNFEPITSDINNEIKGWFINRFLFSGIDNSLCDYEKNNLKLSKSFFELLDSNLSFKTVTSDFEIILKNRDSEIYFEMLSDGYKACIFILLSIVKRIEYHCSQRNASDFDGVIMIDEADMHLHPRLQLKFIEILTQIFSKAQIIITTHSPNILQNAKANEIIPLCKNENGRVCINELNSGEYGLQGWTIEEILEHVMGISSTSSELFNKIISDFDKALNNENQTEILKNYRILKKMLHPLNPMMQLLEIQVSEWKD